MGKWSILGTSTAAHFRSAVGACLATACHWGGSSARCTSRQAESFQLPRPQKTVNEEKLRVQTPKNNRDLLGTSWISIAISWDITN